MSDLKEKQSKPDQSDPTWLILATNYYVEFKAVKCECPSLKIACRGCLCYRARDTTAYHLLEYSRKIIEEIISE